MSQTLTILGSTGSIGQSTLDVVAGHPDRYSIFALTAYKNHRLLLEQCLKFQPKFAVMVDVQAAKQLQEGLRAMSCQTEVLGADDLNTIASQADMVMAGIVGAAGLLPTLAAVKAGKQVLLANKEPLVMAGQLFFEVAKQTGAQLIPVDSEHNAIFQCLPTGYQTGETPLGIEKIILTASGGPFRETPLEHLTDVTPEQAVAHPTWNMGAKISVDSATMLNKGLEVIEAHWLFNIPLDQIEVVIHPQSTVHSIVAYKDGSMLAQLGDHDMRIPIASALSWPDRIFSGVRPLNFKQLINLTFEPIDIKRFPCLSLAYQAMRAGSAASVVLNASNEVAVDTFLAGKIRFTDIPNVIDYCLNKLSDQTVSGLESILALDQSTRSCAAAFQEQIVSTKTLATS